MTSRVGDGSRVLTMVGYCWPWTVRPGEHLDFMVSAEPGDQNYRADLVRIICADSLSDPAMFKEQELRAPFNGLYLGRHQATHSGSYVEIAPSPVLNLLESFTVQAMVMPTLLPGGVHPRRGAYGGFSAGAHSPIEAHVFQDQHLVSRWNQQNQCGWAVLIDANGHPAFICGDGTSVHRTTLGRSLIQDQWFFVVVAYDATRRAVSIYARHVSNFVKSNVGWPETRIERRHSPNLAVVHEGPLRFAACADGSGNSSRLKPGLCFSGRLDRVRLSGGVLDDSQAFTLASSAIPDSLVAPLVGFWDFGKGIDSVEVCDISSNRLDGVTVNMPLRAVTGVGWDNSVTDWRQRPDHYSAIHFHDDDLYDAEWASDFSYSVPLDMPSGIYAARLRNGTAEDYIPFFVAPPRGRAVASVALLIPTATYTAYSNLTNMTASTVMRKRRILGKSAQPQVIEEDRFTAILQNEAHADFLMKNFRTLGKGLYASHTDGTLCAVASQKHPNMTIKPKGIQWTLVADTLMTDWLEKRAIPYDIITDELLHKEGVDLLCRYKVVITGNHPEYYSKAMLDAVEQYQEVGGRLMYLGGGGFFWVASFHDHWPGAIEVRKDMYSGYCKRYELRHGFDGVHGGRWEDNGRALQPLLGVGCNEPTGCEFEGSAPYRRLPDSYHARATFIFAGVDREIFGDYGILSGGAAGQEFDCISAELGTPVHALHLARTDTFTPHVSMLDEEYESNAPLPFGDIVYFETSNGGAVFSAASMTWVGSLSHNNYDNDVARITENVLRRFMDDTPLA